MQTRPVRRLLLALFVLCSICLPAAGEEAAAPSRGGFSLQILPGYNIPLDMTDVLKGGLGGSLNAEFRFPFLPLLYARGGVSYDRITTHDVPVLTVIDPFLGAGVWLDPISWLSIKAFLTGGYSFGTLQGLGVGTLTGGSLSATAGVESLFRLLRSLSVSVGAEALYYHQLYLGIRPYLGASYHFGAPARSAQPALPKKPAAKEPATQPAQPRKPEQLIEEPAQQGRGLELTATYGNIFPVFQTWYDSHPLGRMTVVNNEDDQIADVRVTFFIRQYMDGPKECGQIARLGKGESAQFDLSALFTNRILEITEPTKSLAEISVQYTKGGKSLSQKRTDTVRLYDRNAMTWADDRGAASFVTTRDPAVMSFSNYVVGMVKGKVTTLMSQKLLQAMAIHEQLDLYGMNYVIDPQSSYATAILARDSVDYLKFPRQTLEYKGGDCDDLAILFCALLESVGIETAFITTPGHIYMAFALDMSPEEARKAFQRPDELILRDGKTWLPLEITERGSGFMAAWQSGAKQWRENLARSQAVLLPLREAWKVFEPVGLPGAGSSLPLPAQGVLLPRFLAEHEKFVAREIFAQEAKLQAEIKKQEAPKSVNSLGILYARYGLFEKAEREFQRILAKTEYVPALLNMGNLAYLRNDPVRALQFYDRAYKKEPKNAQVLLAEARANHDLENYGQVKLVYGQLKAIDPDLAGKYAYLDLKGQEASRAADISGMKEKMEWAAE